MDEDATRMRRGHSLHSLRQMTLTKTSPGGPVTFNAASRNGVTLAAPPGRACELRCDELTTRFDGAMANGASDAMLAPPHYYSRRRATSDDRVLLRVLLLALATVRSLLQCCELI